MRRLFLNPQNTMAVLSIIIVVIGAIFWFATVNGLPKQVENHEGRITTLEHEKIAMQVKMDLTYNTLQEIKADVKQLLKDR